MVMVLRGGWVVALGLLARAAWAQSCPDSLPCAPCVEAVATATCRPRKVKLRTVEVATTPAGAQLFVSKNGKPHKGKPHVTPHKLSVGPKDQVELTLERVDEGRAVVFRYESAAGEHSSGRLCYGTA